ncbi:uncharacterized protein L203_100053 [Cryptococcus depauperatus CBS 7841]|uniref:Uncharacterized protein n=1 Tax=Cryptococcus depauperatus CBS 7841 TaxID=1295531 RepID=A0A1E3IZQ8_9TREE|nr:hypothetical protein L203_00289 [Cryptococcus depauperatus CBS 7841]
MDITIDDTSPQFQYYSSKSSWSQKHTDDSQTVNYYKQTFYATFTDGDSVSLTFNGTAVTIYGALRSNHGIYSTQLDGGSISYQSGYSADAKFQQVLFAASNLSSDQEHQVVLTNLPSQTDVKDKGISPWWFDVDYAVITTPTSGEIFTTEFDDTSSFVSYFGTGWTAGPPLQPDKYYNSTAHITSVVGDSMQLKFNGSSIQVFGGLYTDHGNYSVSIDGGKTQNFNGTFFNLQPRTTLYQASHLEDGPHILLITNLGQGPSGNFFDFDYAIVNSTINPMSTGNTTDTGTTLTSISTASSTIPSNSNGSNTGNSNHSTSNSSNTNVAGVVGGIVGGVVALALIALTTWWLFKKLKRRRGSAYMRPGRSPNRMDLNDPEIKPYMGPEIYTLPFGTSSSSRDLSVNSRSPGLSPNIPDDHSPRNPFGSAGRGMSQQSLPFLTRIPSPPSSSVPSYARSIKPPSWAGDAPHSSRFPNSQTGTFERASTAVATSEYHDHPVSTNGPQRSSTKSAGVTLPYTAYPPSATDDSIRSIHHYEGTNETERSQPSLSRMYVPGREQDMGPVTRPQDHEDPEGMLPPNYSQATEPLPDQRRT